MKYSHHLSPAKRRLRLFGLGFFFVLCVSGSLFLINSSKHANASPVTGFNAGNIMDDAVFTNAGSMDTSQIQAFLNSKVPVCDTAGTQTSEFGGGTRAQWGAAHGYPAPFVCLKDYSENGLSAAQIINNTAQQYQINPQVLIIMLQKEQGLVTDTWPIATEYKSATGYGCPDSAPCDAQYYGLTNQLNQTGRMFRAIMNASSTWYSPYIVGNNSILWNPNSACGSSTVNIQNRTTQALYDYTPYQPNQAALNAGYGTGDSCSSYGNRNFYQYFTDWFGSTHNPPLSWQPEDLNIYDEGKNSILATDNLHAGERLWISLKVKNIGSTTWYRDGSNPTILGTDNPMNHNSPYCDTTWISCSRVTKIKEASVAPGEEGHFEFYAAASNVDGTFREYFTPVLEYQGWMANYTGFEIYSRTTDYYSWAWGGVTAWSDAAHTVAADLNHLTKGQQVYLTVNAKNTSATTWSNTGSSPLRLATSDPQDQSSPLCSAGWISCNRLSTMNESQVLPGQTASFSTSFKAPSTLGEFRQYVKPVLEYKGWTEDDLNHIYMDVTQ